MVYPQIHDPQFIQKITKIYKQFKIKKLETFRDICFPKSFNLQMQQKLLAAYINPKTPYRRLLVYHKIGAGKTCTAIQIAEQWIGKKKIVVILPASLVGNFRNELRSYCCRDCYISKSDTELLKKLDPSSKEYKKIIQNSNDKIDKDYTIYSYNKIFDLLFKKKINLSNSLIIVDEVHNIISDKGFYYNTFLNHLKICKNYVLVLMSATPMYDKPTELPLLLNLLNDKKLPTGADFINKYIHFGNTIKIKNLAELIPRLQGIVSFYKGAPSYVFPEIKFHVVKCEMSKFQHDVYKKILLNENKSSSKKFTKSSNDILKYTFISDLPNNFFIGTRIASNIVFPNLKNEGIESLTTSIVKNHLDKYSCKIYKLVKKVKKAKRTVLIYSNFKEYGGVRSLIKILECLGYTNYASNGKGKRRFAIWSGDESMPMREEIKSIFNSQTNLYGEQIKILIGTPAIKEGISLYRVEQVHVLEPTWNWSKLDQIIGRAVRFCSHKDIPKDDRVVSVYLYIATFPNQKTIEQHIFELAIKKREMIKQFDTILKQYSIDKELFLLQNKMP